MERAAYDLVDVKTPLEKYIGRQNGIFARWASMISRIQRRTILAVTTTSSITTAHDIIEVDTTGGAVTLNLLIPVLDARGHVFFINHHTGGNNVIFDPLSAEQVDGAATATFTGRRAYYSNGTQWRRLY